MKARHLFLLGSTLASMLLLNAYLFLQSSLWNRAGTAHAEERSLASACTRDETSTAQTNPNALLFISCGGYLE